MQSEECEEELKKLRKDYEDIEKVLDSTKQDYEQLKILLQQKPLIGCEESGATYEGKWEDPDHPILR